MGSLPGPLIRAHLWVAKASETAPSAPFLAQMSRNKVTCNALGPSLLAIPLSITSFWFLLTLNALP